MRTAQTLTLEPRNEPTQALDPSPPLLGAWEQLLVTSERWRQLARDLRSRVADVTLSYSASPSEP